ncbi:MAG TPA: outer membrane protein transport protein [Holophagaceae bacterium]|jgi:long-subunit fatty acid transport protein|nr:outer membrane protein transport protein [Holophagaceae bacterium]
MAVRMCRWSGSALISALVLGLGGALHAQAPSLPAADAVGVGRAGTGAAFGRSLEAATLNPALLPTLQDKLSVYVSAGFELQEAQVTLQSNQIINETSDRNRLLAGFGLAWKASDQLAYGLKLDQPWERHGLLPDNAPGRFLGREWNFSARRLEAQAAYEPASLPGFSIGLGVGVTRLSFTGTNTVRAVVPQDGTQPASGTNPVIALAEQSLTESASATRPSFTLGARWAINPRWTLGATYQSAVTGDLALSSGYFSGPSYVGTNGYPPVLAGSGTQGAAMLARSTVRAGDGSFKLPAKATLGVRNRLNNLFTWEFDLHATQGGLRMPSWASLDTPNGTVSAPGEIPATKSALGFSALGEVDLTKKLVLRGGIAIDPSTLDGGQTNPVLGGAANATFTIGGTYRIWGGELSVGYAYRQSRKIVVQQGIDGTWDQGGYQASGTPARVEGMGHLISFGYKFAF